MKNSTTISLNNTMNLDEAAKFISACGRKVTTLLVGEPGVGKTSILKTLAEQFPSHKAVYIDTPVTDVPELGMPSVEVQHDGVKRTISALHEQWSPDEPCIYMLDEIGKMVGITKLVLTRFMLERNILGKQIHPDSIIFATTNLATDGVGDSIPAHMNNRVTRIQIRKPTSDEWINWGVNNGVDPIILAWVDQFPHCLASYLTEESNDNLYIFNPKRNTGAFVTPRSLEKGSHIVKQRHIIGAQSLIVSLSGTLGEPAARDMQAFFTMADQLESYNTIETHPNEAKLPANVAALLMMVFGLVTRADKKTFNNHLAYVKRMPVEMHALWARTMVNSSNSDLAISNGEFAKFASALGVLLF
jgi:hypothetical protein